MTAEQLDTLIRHLRMADAAIRRGEPHLARLHATIVRVTMARAGLRYRDLRDVFAIDDAITRAATE